MYVKTIVAALALSLCLSLPVAAPAAAKSSQTTVSKSGKKHGSWKKKRKSRPHYARTKASRKHHRSNSKLTYRRGEARAKTTSYSSLGIRNLRHAKKTRMSTRHNSSRNSVRRFGERVSYKFRPGTVVISNYTRRLYYVVRPGKVISYPIATPRPNEIWTGSTKISEKKVNPDWYPTPDMREENPDLPEKVSGGTRANPLGPRALYLGSSLYRIHGTNNPRSIGRSASGGCYRMYNKHIKKLYSIVRVGTPVVVTNSKNL